MGLSGKNQCSKYEERLNLMHAKFHFCGIFLLGQSMNFSAQPRNDRNSGEGVGRRIAFTLYLDAIGMYGQAWHQGGGGMIFLILFAC